MRDITRNSLKVLLGFLFNVPLLLVIGQLGIIAISVIQTIAFAVFYTVIDKVIGD